MKATKRKKIIPKRVIVEYSNGESFIADRKDVSKWLSDLMIVLYADSNADIKFVKKGEKNSGKQKSYKNYYRV